ncbi:hypothetical protein D3C73_760570 [compost metagenome]
MVRLIRASVWTANRKGARNEHHSGERANFGAQQNIAEGAADIRYSALEIQSGSTSGRHYFGTAHYFDRDRPVIDIV